MSDKEESGVGCLSIIGYFIIIAGVYNFITGSFKGDHINDDGEFTTFDDTLKLTIFMLVIGVVILIINKFRKR